MKKNIKVNFIFPPNEEGGKKAREPLDEFGKEIVLSNLKRYNCGYKEKLRILKELSS